MNITCVERIVEQKLKRSPKCYRHCQEQSTLKLLPGKQMLVGSYSCPSGYVSRIVAYGRELDLNGFKALLSSALQGVEEVTDEDIRIATRYTWDLGIKEEPDGIVLKEAYWTQNYGKRKNEDPNRHGLFLCTKCGSFYGKQIENTNTLCPRCRSSSA